MPADVSSRDRERSLGDRLFLAIAVTLVVGVGAAQILYGELFAGHGIGKGDPRFYTWMAQDFRGVVLGGKLDSYRLQRVLPPALVSATLSVLGLPKRDDVVMRAFSIYNLLLLVATGLLWNGIARSLAISLAGRWLGFLLLFGNFACSRVPFYNPIWTDTTALALGALLLFGFVRSNGVLVLFGVIASALTWPALPGLGALFFAFPRAPLPVERGMTRRGWSAAALIAAAYCAELAWALHSVDLKSPLVRPPGGLGEVSLHTSWLPVSVAVVLVYLLGAFAPLLEPASLYRIEEHSRSLRLRRWLPLGLVAAGVLGFVRAYSSGAPAVTSSLAIAEKIVAEAVLRPGQSLVAHAVYLGILPVLLIVFWDRACRAAHRLGFAMTLFTASTVALALSCESRLLMHALVPLVLLAVLALEDLRLPSWAPWVLTGIAFTGSKVWFGINHEGFMSRDPVFSYPAQYWWMNIGPWMADEMWALQGSLALATLLIVVWMRLAARPLAHSEREVIWPTNRAVLAFPRAAAVIGSLVLLVEWPSRWMLESRATRVDPVTRRDSAKGWENVPGARVRLRQPEFEVELAFNALGLRGPERRYEKPAGTRRVALLGGSFAEGYAVPEERSLRALLEQQLGAQGCGSVEVINLGVAGYDTEQQLRFFDLEGRRYGPDAVLVLFQSEDLGAGLRMVEAEADAANQTPNIIAGVPSRLRESRLAPLHRWHGSAFLRLASNGTLEHWPKAHRALGRLGIVDLGRPPRELWPYGPREEVETAWRQARESLAKLAAEVREQGGQTLVAYAPAHFETSDPAWQELLLRYQMSPRFWRPTRVATRLAAVTAELGIPTLDLRDALRASETSSRRLYFARAGQWNEAGHATAARALGARLGDSLGCGAARGSAP